jgi:hypothetical protein
MRSRAHVAPYEQVTTDNRIPSRPLHANAQTNPGLSHFQKYELIFVSSSRALPTVAPSALPISCMQFAILGTSRFANCTSLLCFLATPCADARSGCQYRNSRRGTHRAAGFAADGFRTKVRQTLAVTIFQIESTQ